MCGGAPATSSSVNRQNLVSRATPPPEGVGKSSSHHCPPEGLKLSAGLWLPAQQIIKGKLCYKSKRLVEPGPFVEDLLHTQWSRAHVREYTLKPGNACSPHLCPLLSSNRLAPDRPLSNVLHICRKHSFQMQFSSSSAGAPELQPRHGAGLGPLQIYFSQVCLRFDTYNGERSYLQAQKWYRPYSGHRCVLVM